ncbi:hypothetical protein [Kordiimonas gwangyangensis]|uniref:hypothetical protein n=1 Tax=Kordiimonas gwangyangensis TaxID=288022 RepID=UPI00192E5BAB|nr:hypothetical protein [Kordiimonas gwangyangensis]
MTTTQSVILGDAVAELARMQASSVDLIIADPPITLARTMVPAQTVLPTLTISHLPTAG